MATFFLLDSGENSAEENMAIDRELLQKVDTGPQCLLHLYSWQSPSATYGYFSRPAELLAESAISKYGLELARRPTGGGVIFHQFDCAFSLLLSADHPRYVANVLESYRLINGVVCRVIERYCALLPHFLSEDVSPSSPCSGNFCMARPTIYDLLIAGRKVAGASQRRTRKGLLHQGTISLLLPPDDFLETIFCGDRGVAQSMRKYSYPLLGRSVGLAEFETAIKVLQELLAKEFSSW